MNKSLALEKGLIINDSLNLYKKIENIYKYLFEVYLFSKVNLKQYDDEIKNSNFYFGVPKPNEQQLLSGLNEYMNLNYIYILNNFFVEKLDITEIQSLKNIMSSGKIELTDDLLNLVERTYKEIIRVDYFDDIKLTEKTKINYGSAVPSNFVDNDALVIKIFYSKNTISLSDEDYIKNIDNQNKLLEDVSIKIKNDINKALDITCEILNEKIPN